MTSSITVVDPNSRCGCLVYVWPDTYVHSPWEQHIHRLCLSGKPKCPFHLTEQWPRASALLSDAEMSRSCFLGIDVWSPLLFSMSGQPVAPWTRLGATHSPGQCGAARYVQPVIMAAWMNCAEGPSPMAHTCPLHSQSSPLGTSCTSRLRRLLGLGDKN